MNVLVEYRIETTGEVTTKAIENESLENMKQTLSKIHSTTASRITILRII